MNRVIILAIVATTIGLAFTGPAAAQTVYRDARGRIVATESTVGGVRVYRDASGRMVGSESTVGGTRIYRGPNGRTLGTATPFGGNR